MGPAVPPTPAARESAPDPMLDPSPAQTPLPDPPPQGGRESEGSAPARRRAVPPSRAWSIAFVALWVIVALPLVGLALIVGTVRDMAARLPAPPRPAEVAVSAVVLDRNDRLLRPFTIAVGRWRLPVTRTEVDPRYLAMLLAYEDGDFATHHGIDYPALARAVGQMVLNGRPISGGSTLTMQVARLIAERDTRSLADKLRQIAAATRLEAALSKDEILTLYLMLAPFGGNLEGVRAATLAYFGKEPTRLTAAEAALLVALPQSPEARRPDRFPAAALAARDRVLDRVAAAGIISEDEAEAAKGEPIPTARRAFPMFAPHLAAEARLLHPELPVQRLTIDRDLQASLERLAAERARGFGPKISIAMVVADHRTGEILASVGSPGLLDEAREGHVDMTRALRSPGSTLKPFIYGLAFELGMALPESLIEDRPTAFGGYAPVNFDGFYRGTVTIREALAQSLNVPAVIVLDAVGPARLMARLRRAGVAPTLPDLSSPGLAIGLGGVGVSLRDLTGAYAAIARGGSVVALRDGLDRPAAVPPQAGTTLLDPLAAFYVTDILAGVAPPVNGSPGRIAYKTGTSYGYRDAWALGFDGRTVIGVWVGRPDGAPVPGLSGVGGAAPVLFEAFDRRGRETAPLPPVPADAILSPTAALPGPLKRFRHPDQNVVARDTSPEIAFPPDGVRVDLGAAAGGGMPLVVKVRNGAAPFTFLANGVPIARSAFAREESWMPDGPGFVTIAVIDGKGRSDRVTVFVE